jgi:O-acetyl-ADP-ribose deacetylase (regulator of RNase III)
METSMGELIAEKGGITRDDVDAIVDAANIDLAEGGGVCGADAVLVAYQAALAS